MMHSAVGQGAFFIDNWDGLFDVIELAMFDLFW